MIKAIVYTSNAGHTQAYAEMLGKKTNYPVYTLKQAKKNLHSEDGILYMGWIMGGNVCGYIQAANLFTIEILCGVGMFNDSEEQRIEIIDKYDISDCDVFTLKGGFDMEKLRGFKKTVMRLTLKGLINDMKKRPLSPENDRIYKILSFGENCVCEENLEPVIRVMKMDFVKPTVTIEQI